MVNRLQPLLIATSLLSLSTMPVMGVEGETLLQSTAEDLVVQGVTRITGVQLNQTEEGVELVLDIARNARLVPLIFPQGNTLVIDILDATLAFSLRDGVTETNPAPGISSVTVNQVDERSIRVTITGEGQAPSAEVVPGRDNLGKSRDTCEIVQDSLQTLVLYRLNLTVCLFYSISSISLNQSRNSRT